MTTKQYLRFEPGNVFGVVASSTAKILQFNRKNKKNNLFAVPACENVYVWNLQSKEKVQVFNGEKSSVTCSVIDGGCRNIAVGYRDGTIQIFNLRSGKVEVSFIGHKSAVSCLTYEDMGSNLASGGTDSEIVLWNVTDETGLVRLRGHKGPITKCIFYKSKNFLISSSRDRFIKFWDLDTNHCFHTIVGNRSEVLDCVLIKESKLVAGFNDKYIKFWDIVSDTVDQEKNTKKLKTSFLKISSGADQNTSENVETAEENGEQQVKVVDAAEIETVEMRICSIVVDSTERLLGYNGSGKQIYIFKIRNEAEIDKRLQKLKKIETKRKSTADVELKISDELPLLGKFELKAKVDSFTLSLEEEATAMVTVLFKNNSIAQYSMKMKLRSSELDLLRNITIPGHHSNVMTLSYSSDNVSILSASDESIKIWKSFNEEQACCNTLECRFALCSVFVAGNNHCIIGNKKGELKIYDIYASELLDTIKGHGGPIQCIESSPGQRGITTGGSDKEVKFWDFELISDSNYSDVKKRLSLVHKRTLKMAEEVICLRYSPDEQKLAISLLDSTVQVLFADTLKLAFSLYGHALPVTCLDISHDSSLIVTGSEDKDVRIWSMEFGSCNKFLKKAHNKGITCLRFLPKTHLFFTGSRDNCIKQWDADNFQKIITLKGHQNEITAMTVSPDGASVVTASRDKSIRMWNKTREPLILQEEQEEEEFENLEEIEDLPPIVGEINKEVALPGVKTIETIKTVDQLIEALNTYSSEILKLAEFNLECKTTGKKLPLPAQNPLFMAYRVSTPLEYFRKMLQRLKSSELEGTLLHLPFNYVLDFLRIISELVERGWETELCERCVSFIVRIHFGQLSTAIDFQPIIEKMKNKLFDQVYHTRDMIGYAKVVSNIQQQAIDSREEVSMFASLLENVEKKKKRNRRKLERPIITYS